MRPSWVLRRALVLLVLGAMVACGDASVEEVVAVVDPEQYLDTLPAYPEPPAAYDRALDGATFERGEQSVCSTTTYEIGDAPKEVVMFNTDPQVMWPGALIQGDSYENGSPLLIPLPHRAPLDLSIQGLYAEQSSALGVTPTQSSVAQAVNGLLAVAVHDGTPSTQSIFFNQKEAYSFEQASLKLGFSARYLGSRVKGSLRYSTTSTESTVMANATIRTFTISVDQPPTPSAFFDGLSSEELEEQIALGRMSETNLPVYVASVTYGQIMMFSATSSASTSELKGALSASFNSFAGGGSANLSAEQRDVLAASEITVVTLGGSEEGVATLIREGEPAAFFEGSAVVTSSVPIAYTLKDLRGNIVKIGESTEYGLTTCTPTGTANVYALSTADHVPSVLGYYADGSEAELSNRISVGLTDPETEIAYVDIAYDALEDSILVLSRTASPFNVGRPPSAGVGVYAADGTRLSSFRVDSSAAAMVYDPIRARVYVAGGYGEGRVLDAYNTNGDFLFSFETDMAGTLQPTAVTHDATRERIYVALEIVDDDGATLAGTVAIFDFQGNEVEVAGGFDGIREPQGIAYDPSSDRIFVSDRFDETVKVFDADGGSIALPTPIDNLSEPRGLLFEATTNRLYVVNQGSSLITAYEPDGTPATGLAMPAFPNLNRPSAIAYRPF